MRAKTIYLSLILFSVSFGCTDLEIDSAKKSGLLDQEVYFEVTYKNKAWGNRHEGFIVDKSGEVKAYKNPENWNEAHDNKGILTATQMKENIDKTVVTKVKVDAVKLKAFTDKIPNITATDFTKRIAIGNDLGQTIYYAYTYDSSTNTYLPILLSETGDWKSENKDIRAIEITKWLTDIQISLE